MGNCVDLLCQLHEKEARHNPQPSFLIEIFHGASFHPSLNSHILFIVDDLAICSTSLPCTLQILKSMNILNLIKV